MNNTNRALNRLLAAFAGLLLLALGTAAVLTATVPAIRDGWAAAAPEAFSWTDSLFESAVVPGTPISWWWIGIAAALVAIALMLVAFIVRQGHGRTSTLVRAPSPDGESIIGSKVAEQLVQAELDARPDLVAANVTTYLVGSTPVLGVSLTARRGVSPRQVVDDVEESIDALRALLGTDLPASIQVGGGFRARLSSPARTGRAAAPR